jgi:hypothetical protein
MFKYVTEGTVLSTSELQFNGKAQAVETDCEAFPGPP